MHSVLMKMTLTGPSSTGTVLLVVICDSLSPQLGCSSVHVCVSLWARWYGGWVMRETDGCKS